MKLNKAQLREVEAKFKEEQRIKSNDSTLYFNEEWNRSTKKEKK